MPFQSKAQQGYFNANRKKLEGQGVDVDEWNESSKGLKLPAKSSDPDLPMKRKALFGKKGKNGPK